MIISKTPLRICYFGGSSDYKSFFSRNAPILLISAAINKYCYVSVSKLPDFEESNFQIVCSSFQKTRIVDDIKNNGIRGTLKYLKEIYPDLNKISIYISNPDVSPKTGTASSSAMISSLLNCIHTQQNYKYYSNKNYNIISKKKLAEESILIERGEKYCNEFGGIGDEIIVNYGGLNSIEIDCLGNFTVRPLSVSDDFVKYFLNSHILFFISDKNGFQVAKSHDDLKADKYKIAIRDLSIEAKKSFDKEDIEEIGKLLEKSWQEKRKISSLVSNQIIDEIHDTAIQAGAWGGKVLGSGGTGIFLVLCPVSKREQIINSIGLPVIPFNFDQIGTRLIYNNTN